MPMARPTAGSRLGRKSNATTTVLPRRWGRARTWDAGQARTSTSAVTTPLTPRPARIDRHVAGSERTRVKCAVVSDTGIGSG